MTTNIQINSFQQNTTQPTQTTQSSPKPVQLLAKKSLKIQNVNFKKIPCAPVMKRMERPEISVDDVIGDMSNLSVEKKPAISPRPLHEFGKDNIERQLGAAEEPEVPCSNESKVFQAEPQCEECEDKNKTKEIESISENTEPVEITENIKNRGTGAGGKNTNKNGLPYEQLTDLKSHYDVIISSVHHKEIIFHGYEVPITTTKQSNVFKHLSKYISKDVEKAHGCKNPDECFIDHKHKVIFILEKKFQQVSGSVCEKIQTPDFKIWQYSRTFPDFEIVYMYCLSDWFKDNCKAELTYLEYKNIPVFWGNDANYKPKIINFIMEHCKKKSVLHDFQEIGSNELIIL